MTSASVAHELLHTCNVYHHGDGDLKQALWVTAYDEQGKMRIYPAAWGTEPDGTQGTTFHRVEGAARIKLFLEDHPDAEIDPPADLQLASVSTVYIGMPHGQHSGVENCVMRYRVATVYPKGAPLEYFWVKGTERDIAQNDLCTGAQGYSINRPGRRPQPRYGDADGASQRGNCAGQILVNDAIIAPLRTGKTGKK
jgi:hypothetical protein